MQYVLFMWSLGPTRNTQQFSFKSHYQFKTKKVQIDSCMSWFTEAEIKKLLKHITVEQTKGPKCSCKEIGIKGCRDHAKVDTGALCSPAVC